MMYGRHVTLPLPSRQHGFLRGSRSPQNLVFARASAWSAAPSTQPSTPGAFHTGLSFSATGHHRLRSE